MHFLRRLAVAALTALLCTQQCSATAPSMYTDPKTHITFGTWSFGGSTTGDGAYTFGMALPEDALKKNATEYIGLLVRPSFTYQTHLFLYCFLPSQRGTITNSSYTGWMGISHGGHMINSLLLMAYPYRDVVETSFRYTTAYRMPVPYTGDAALTQISHAVGDTTFEVIYRCERCFAWQQEGDPAGSTNGTTAGVLELAHSMAKLGPANPACPKNITFGFHDNGYGTYEADLRGVESPLFPLWALKATEGTKGACGSVKAPCWP